MHLCNITKVVVISLLMAGASVQTTYAEPAGFAYTAVDDEYDTYRKQADELFTQGEYEKAIKKYRACMAVAEKYENDPYAMKMIVTADKLHRVRAQGLALVQEGRPEEANASFMEVLKENPADLVAREQVGNYYSTKGTKLFKQNQYEQAKGAFQQALPYLNEANRTSINLLIEQSNAALAQQEQARVAKEQEIAAAQKAAVTPPATEPAKVVPSQPQPSITVPKVTYQKRSIWPKLLVGAIGLGAGAYGMMLNSQYQSALATHNTLSRQLDPSGGNVIFNATDYGAWKRSYDNLTTMRGKRSAMMASFGVAGAAAVADIIMLALPAKQVKLSGNTLYLQPQATKLALRYELK